MRQSIIDRAPDTAWRLAQHGLAVGMVPIDAINNGSVPGMRDVASTARGRGFLPDMMASAEGMSAAMAILNPELRRLGSERPMANALETAMLDLLAGRQISGLAYACVSSRRRWPVIDAQVEMESGISAVPGVLAGINMSSSAGMLDFLVCHSLEKLVIDAEATASAQRLIEGIAPRGISLALDRFVQTG